MWPAEYRGFVGDAQPVAFRQSDHCPLRIGFNVFGDPLLARLALMSGRQCICKVRVDLKFDQTEGVEPFWVDNGHVVRRAYGWTGQIGAGAPADERHPTANPRCDRFKQTTTSAFAQKLEGIAAANHNHLGGCNGIERIRYRANRLDRNGSLSEYCLHLLCIRFPGNGDCGERYE